VVNISKLSSLNVNLIEFLESSNRTGSTLAFTEKRNSWTSLIMYLTVPLNSWTWGDLKTKSNPAVQLALIIYGFKYDSYSSILSTANYTEIDVLKSFLIWNVLTDLDFTKTVSKSSSVLPTKMCYNFSADKIILQLIFI
jgi:hypothetical protein